MKSLWIGRDPGGAGAWIDAAGRAGWHADALPLIRREILKPSGTDLAVLEGLDQSDWLFLTSGAAVECGLQPLRTQIPALGAPRLAVVGPGTAEAVERARAKGFPLGAVELHADGRGGAALAEAFLAGPAAAAVRDRPLVWLCAASPRPELAGRLADAGWDLRQIAVYRTLEIDGPVPESHQPVLVFSPSGIHALSRRTRHCPVLALGPTTALAASEAGFRVLATLDAATPEALTHCLQSP